MGLLDQLNKESKVKLAPPSEVVQIDISQLQEHPNNFFSMNEEELSALREDIETNGLNTCLRIRRLPEDHELYSKEKPFQILVGHRRYRAISGTSIKFVDCKIVNCNEIEAEKILITDNMTARKISAAEQLEAIRRLKELFKKEKQDGNLPGRISYLIAQETGLSKSQVGNYEKILNNASDKTLKAIKDGNLSIKGAVNLCELDEDEQEEFIEGYEDEEITVSEVKKHVDDKRPKIEQHKEQSVIEMLKEACEDDYDEQDGEIDDTEAIDFALSIIGKQAERLEVLLDSQDYLVAVQVECIKKAVKEIKKQLGNE